jgi:voltage-gated potassium channel Kch
MRNLHLFTCHISFPESSFSVVTFTTLGYGDLQPTPNMRWLSGIEAFLGAALMAMFIVALARKFTR